MNRNLFATAIEKNEVNDFFLGRNSYFARNRETGEHSYITHITGWAAEFIDEGDQNLSTFVSEFTKFTTNIEDNEYNTKALLSLLIGIAMLLNNKKYSLDQTDEKNRSKMVQAIRNYLRKSNSSFNKDLTVKKYANIITSESKDFAELILK